MDIKKIELDLINKMKAQLKEKTVIRVPFKTFIKLWEPKDDFDLTKRLIKFKIDNELDYVVIIDNIRGPQFIRFWDNSKKLLEKGESNAVCDTRKTEEIKQSSGVNGRTEN